MRICNQKLPKKKQNKVQLSSLLSNITYITVTRFTPQSLNSTLNVSQNVTDFFFLAGVFWITHKGRRFLPKAFHSVWLFHGITTVWTVQGERPHASLAWCFCWVLVGRIFCCIHGESPPHTPSWVTFTHPTPEWKQMSIPSQLSFSSHSKWWS